MRIVVAIGGNALLLRGEAPDAATQRTHLAAAARSLAALCAGNQVVVVHGNGPQVGMLALESEADPALSRPYPLGDLVAESQGLIGSWIEQALVGANVGRVATLVTHVGVDPADPAFAAPTKLIGQVYDDATAGALADRHGWTVRPDGAGWRRVVPSPQPVSIEELPVAGMLLERGVTVVLAGGGGIPVVRRDASLEPVEAVIDKDRVAALAADRLDADLLVVLTDVEGVMTGFGTPEQAVVRSAAPGDLDPALFPAGSMGPKVAAACDFVAGGVRRRAAIGALGDAERVVRGAAGTQITGARALVAADV